VLAAGWERERDGAAADSDPAAAPAAWERRAHGLGRRGRAARALFDGFRDGNGLGRAITRPLAKRLRVEICTRTHTHG
jgi:hypothetical protein